MKVLVVGAAGKTGRQVVAQAVKEGHHVTSLVHSASDQIVPGVEVRVGDGSDPATVDAAVAGQDAVIDLVGGKTPYRSTTLETDVATAIITAMQRHSTRRLIVTSSIGVGDSTAHAPFAVTILMKTFLRGAGPDKAQMEAAVRSSGLDWTVARPAVLNDRPATGSVTVHLVSSRRKARGITRADLAAFLVAQLTDRDHLGCAVTIANG